MADRDVQIKISLQDELSRGLAKMEGSVASLGSKMGKVTSDVASFGLKLGAVAGAAISAQTVLGVKWASDMQMLSTSFQTLTGSAEKGKEVFKDLKKMGASTPFETEDLAKATQTMLSFGMSVEQSKKMLSVLGDVSMGNKEKLGSLSLAFSQVQSTGRLMGQDLLQMINQGFNPLQIISEKTGKSMAVLKSEMEKGKISAKMVTDAFITATSEGGLFYQGMDRGAKTLSGTFSTLTDGVKNATTAFLGLNDEGDIVKGSLLDLVQNGVNILNERLSAIDFVAWGQKMNDYVTNKVKELSSVIQENLPWIEVARKFLNGETITRRDLPEYISKINTAMTLEEIKNMQEKIDKVNQIRDTIQNFANGTLAFVNARLADFRFMWEMLKPAIDFVVFTFNRDLLPALKRLSDLAGQNKGSFDALVVVLTALGQVFLVSLGFGISFLGKTLNLLIDISQFVQKIINGAKQMGDTFKNSFGAWGNVLKMGKNAQGGIIGGNSYVGDNVMTRVNSGEMILNKQQQARLFSMANSGGGGNGGNTINISIQGGTWSEMQERQRIVGVLKQELRLNGIM